MIVKKLAISPISARIPSREAPTPSPKTALNPSKNGVAEVPISAAPPPTPVLRNRMPAAKNDQRRESPHRGAGNVSLRIVRFLGGQRQFFDREVEPDRKG